MHESVRLVSGKLLEKDQQKKNGEQTKLTKRLKITLTLHS